MYCDTSAYSHLCDAYRDHVSQPPGALPIMAKPRLISPQRYVPSVARVILFLSYDFKTICSCAHHALAQEAQLLLYSVSRRGI